MTDYEQRLQQRIDEMTPFKRAFFELDVALTGKPPLQAVTQYHHYPDTALAWIEKQHSATALEWSLSDSGYSRVLFDLDDGKLFLSSVSTSAVKARWDDPQVRDLRTLLESIIHQQLSDAVEGGKDIWYSPKGKDMKDHLPEPPAEELPESKIAGGKGDKLKTKDVDPKELAMGRKTEREHTPDKEAAEDIAKDHLAEKPNYYTRLKKSGLADELKKKKRVKENAQLIARLLLSEAKPYPVCPYCEKEHGPEEIPAGHERVESICRLHLEQTKGRWPGHEEAARLSREGRLAQTRYAAARPKAAFYPGATGST